MWINRWALLTPWRLQIGEIAAHMRFTLVHKGYHPLGDKIRIAGVIFRVVKYNDAVCTSSFCQFAAYFTKAYQLLSADRHFLTCSAVGWLAFIAK
jgi:hypothetical protein